MAQVLRHARGCLIVCVQAACPLQTRMPHFPLPSCEVLRSQGDFQWLYDALCDACPERIIPPLKPPVSLDATMSEFQRFLSRIAAHRILRRHHLFVQFLTGTAEVRGARPSSTTFDLHLPVHGYTFKFSMSA